MLFCFISPKKVFSLKEKIRKKLPQHFTFYCMFCKYKIKSHTILLKLNKLTNDQNKSTKTNACKKYVNK